MSKISLQDTLSYIVKSIVENEDQVNVTTDVQEDMVQLNIFVDKADMGKVIGKEGKVIRAIRNIMKIKAIKEDKKINITLNEA